MACTPWVGTQTAVTGIEFVAAVAVAALYWGSTPAWVLLGGLYVVAVAVARSVMPVRYASRTVWHDTPLSTALGVRCAALLAELTIGAIVAAAYRAARPDDPVTVGAAAAFFVIVAAAQAPATLGVMTSQRWLFALEETLWAVGGAALLVATARLPEGPFTTVMAVSLWVYLGFQSVALPMRWARAPGRVSTLGATDTSRVRRGCGDWGPLYMVWSFGYFVLASALVVYLMTGPTYSSAA